MKVLKFSVRLAAAVVATVLAPNVFAAGPSFSDVWSAVASGSYAAMPEYHSTFSSLFSGGVNILAQSADRTLSDQSDVLPNFQKLVHPIGICFAGTWTIDADSNYTGYFAKGSQGLIIVRASEALGNPAAGGYRSFGFAGKIFPGTDRNASVQQNTANFFTVDDLGGASADSFLDDAKSNQPATSFHLSQLAIFPMLTQIARTFAAADSDPGIRQVYEISELGLSEPAATVTPKWMSIRAETTARNGAADFRDELRLANYPEGLDFGVFVAEDDGNGWTRLGKIHLAQEALSDGCDHRLHFHHPRSK